jgi:hypothetical protein
VCANLERARDGFFERANLKSDEAASREFFEAGRRARARGSACPRSRPERVVEAERARPAVQIIAEARLRNLEARKLLLLTMETMGWDGTRNPAL